MKHKCRWALGRDGLGKNQVMVDYHDQEWGVPVHDDKKHFEFLVLDAFQAGLSWEIILNKREGFREAFGDFDAQKVARFNTRSVERLMTNSGIVRNRLKITATIANAKHFLNIQKEYGSFDKHVWSFVGGKPIQNAWRSMKTVPATSPESDAFSKDLKDRGMKFVGSTILYAYMQAAGMVNDHEVKCFRYRTLGGKAR